MDRDEETETAEIALQPQPGEDRMAFLRRVTDFANAKKVAIHFCLRRDPVVTPTCPDGEKNRE